MAVVAKMVNPTPFNVKIPYQKGVYINVPADGETDLSMGQLDDFRPGKPGSEATKKILDFEGVFLQDTDLSYDFQALTALKAAVRERKDRVKQFEDRTKGSRVAGGVAVDEASLTEVKEAAGYGRMERDLARLIERIKILEGIVNEDENKGAVRQTLDPERTCFVSNPPRQFPSKTALALYLNDNPELKAKHEAFLGTVVTEEEEEVEVYPNG
jgi:hypothetical protein